MSAVQIAGCSGAGKSTVAAMLARRGLAAILSVSDIGVNLGRTRNGQWPPLDRQVNSVDQAL